MFATLGGRNTSDDVQNRGNESGEASQLLMTSKMFDEIARAADYSELGDVRKPRNACRRAAKSLIEFDRLLYSKESMKCTDTHQEGNVVLTRMVPWEVSSKMESIPCHVTSISHNLDIPLTYLGKSKERYSHRMVSSILQSIPYT